MDKCGWNDKKGQEMIMSVFKLVAVSNLGLCQPFCEGSGIEGYVEYLARLISGKLTAGNRFLDNPISGGPILENQGEEGSVTAPFIGGQWKKPDRLIVREKSMEESKYMGLFKGVWERGKSLSGSGETPDIIPHTYLSAARQTGNGRIHLPFSLLQEYHGTGQLEGMEEIGASIHSPEEAVIAQGLGATYLTAGHIFATGCKPGLLPRGISFLEKVCESVSIPVYAIGGIHRDNLSLVQQTKAAGACMMSEYMCIQ